MNLELLLKTAKKSGCVKGCGECCTLVTLSGEEIKEVEGKVGKLPQLPGADIFPEKWQSQKVLQLNGREIETCPLAYGADESGEPLPVTRVEMQKATVKPSHDRSWRPGQTYDQPVLFLEGCGKYQILCSIHEKRSEFKFTRECGEWNHGGRTDCTARLETYLKR